MVFLLCLTLTAVARGEDEDYKYAGEFLNVGAGARALGMGGAFVAVADDGTAAYWSPGGLPFLSNREFSFMHCQQFNSMVKTNFIGYVHPTSKWGAFGISWLRLGVEDIPQSGYIDANGNLMQDFNDANDNDVKDPGELYIERPVIVGYFDDIEDGVFLSYGAKITSSFSAGINLKLIRQILAANESSGWGIDIGTMYQLFQGFKLGLNLQDVTRTKLKWNSATNHEDVIPFSLEFGAAYTQEIASIKSAFTLSFSIDTKYNTETHYGLEWWLAGTLAMRAGLNDGRLSVGAGLRMSAFQVDYAFIGHDDLGNTHRVSTSVRF
jgi:hypothetical protein